MIRDCTFTELRACRAVFVTSPTSHMHKTRPYPCKAGHAVADGRKERPHGDEQDEHWLVLFARMPSKREDPGVEERGLAVLSVKLDRYMSQWQLL